jgi:hypothetical protein
MPEGVSPHAKIVAGGLGCLGIVGLVIVFAFVAESFGLEWRQYFGIKQANVERRIYEESRPFNQGKIQELSRYRLQYLQSESETGKAAILGTIRHTFADYNPDKLENEDLRKFLRDVLNGKSP